MHNQQILKEINDIFIDVLDNEDIELTRNVNSSDIEEWDSLNHIQLIVAIEKHFKLRFLTSEIISWNNVGEMCDAIEKKLNDQ